MHLFLELKRKIGHDIQVFVMLHVENLMGRIPLCWVIHDPHSFLLLHTNLFHFVNDGHGIYAIFPNLQCCTLGFYTIT